MTTKIEWCDESVNPIIGCEPISEGCKNCVARVFAKRGMCEQHKKARKWDGGVYWADGQLEKISTWKKPKKIFIGLMTDLFHCLIPGDWLDRIFETIAENPHHTFMMLTKRPRQMKEVIKDRDIYFPNLWLGVTAENQKRADERIPVLLDIPTPIHFVSCEPLLGPINLRAMWRQAYGNSGWPFLEWIIAGPENGPGKRECQQAWVGDLYCQAKGATVPFFDKRKEDWLDREFPAESGTS